MLLPQPLFEAIRHHMGDHGDWHIARYRKLWLPLDERAAWQRARDKYPDLFYLDERGAGEQFLDFHRMMIRHYKWILANTQNHGKTWYVWPRVPAIYMQRLPSHIKTHALARIEAIINDPASTADQLGAFIERTKLDTSPGSDLHTALHGVINNVESEQFPSHPDLYSASMADLSHAHYNEHFWILHGWIDNIYARWQAAHNIAVEQDALDPSGHNHGNTLIGTNDLTGGGGSGHDGHTGHGGDSGGGSGGDHGGGHGGGHGDGPSDGGGGNSTGGAGGGPGGGANTGTPPFLNEPKPTAPVTSGIGFHHDPILHDAAATPPQDPSDPSRPHKHH
jgi:hypothetical protein